MYWKALGDIEIAMRVLQDSTPTANIIDTQYRSLNCELEVIDESEQVFKVCLYFLSCSFDANR